MSDFFQNFGEDIANTASHGLGQVAKKTVDLFGGAVRVLSIAIPV